MRSFILLLPPLLLIGHASRLEAEGNLSRITPTHSYRIEFGRGSGWHGLDTVKIASDGTVVLHRQRREERRRRIYTFWETATLKLPEEAIGQVLAAVEDSAVLRLDRAYHDPRIADGTQWVLWVQQGTRERTVYCNNVFPHSIVRFAEALDQIMADNGLAEAAWQRVPDAKGRVHENELWESIKR